MSDQPYLSDEAAALSDEAAAADAGPPSPIVARIDRVQAAVAQAAQALAEQQGRSSQERDRSWIARSIIRVFVVAVAAVLVILAVQGLVTKEWQNVTAQATDLIKSAVLPIVTLVLGYYFGQSVKDEAPRGRGGVREG